MWLFPWNANTDFYSQYEIDEEVANHNETSIWSLFKAKRRGSGHPLSIFRFDIRDPKGHSLEQARQSLKRLKTLRHPSILKYVDSFENDKTICVVTENVKPLARYLEEDARDLSDTQLKFALEYGLLNVAKGVDFMNNGLLNHNNINIYSIYVNTCGVWKIGGLDYVCSFGEKPPSLHSGLDGKYTPPERLDSAKARHQGENFAVDSWGMGCLVWECFNKPLAPSSSLKTAGKMPKTLSVHYNKLVQSSPKHRMSPLDFINKCKEASVFFNSKQLEIITTLDEIQFVKDPAKKEMFFTELCDHLESFPLDICKFKILADLINALEFGEAGSSILDPIFKIGNILSEVEFQANLVPCIIKLYMCKDRAIRSKLLQQIEIQVKHLKPNVINDQLFPQIIQGFLDSNFAIRAQTVKSMFHLASKLNHTNLNEELTKHLTGLLVRDKEGGIRANTTVCLGKIAKHLSPETHGAVLLPAFLRMARDPFPPARHAAIAGLTSNEKLFTDEDCATKIMPTLCSKCVDPDANVKRLAFHSLKMFISRLESKIDAVNETSLVKSAPVEAPLTISDTTTESDNGSSSITKDACESEARRQTVEVPTKIRTKQKESIRNGIEAIKIKERKAA